MRDQCSELELGCRLSFVSRVEGEFVTLIIGGVLLVFGTNDRSNDVNKMI